MGLGVDERGRSAESRLDAEGYERLRRATETHREDLLLRLAGEVGLRPAEITRVTPSDVRPHGEHYFLRVAGDDAREAYLPAAVEHDLRKYVRTANVDPDEPLVDVTPRRVQMVISSVATRAAEATGDGSLAGVSSRDLREYFLRRLLVERGMDPRVVMAVGGYDRLERLAPYLEAPDREAVVTAFERPHGPGEGLPAGGGRSPRLRRAIAAVRRVGSSLADAETAQAVGETVCEHLAGVSAYRAAWIVGPAWDLTAASGEAGTDDGPAAAMVDSERCRAVGERALADRTVETVRVETEGPAAGTTTVVPLVQGDAEYGLLCVVPSGGPPSDAERDLLAALGAGVAGTLAAIERKRLLLADSVTQLTLRCSDGEAFLVAVTDALDCTLELEGLAPVEDALLYYLSLEGAAPDAVLDRVEGSDDVADARLVRSDAESSLLELVVTDSPARRLADWGGTVRGLTAERGTVELVGEIADTATVRAALDAVRGTYPETELAAKREVERRTRTTAGVRESLTDRLTDKQASVLRAAYHGGYFEWPRGSTAEELADSVGVASPTLHNHLRKAEGKLLEAVLEEWD